MKITRKPSKALLLLSLAISILALVAWSPTAPDRVVQITTGIANQANTTAGYQGFVAGRSNTITTSNINDFGLVVGNHNVTNAPSSIIAGALNSGDGSGILISGYNNDLRGATVGSNCYYSAAIGQLNRIYQVYGWAIGFDNEVVGTRGVAIGSGTLASNTQSTALGRYNAPMASDDVLVVGNGVNDGNRSTALRITNDGGVYLGRAQGDISMGAYSN